MVTEFAQYYDRFPETYAPGLCRDVDGLPVKVPWLTDHQHKGVPYWWCCTQQPRVPPVDSPMPGRDFLG